MSMQELIESIATGAGWALLHSLWQGALLGLFAAGILMLVCGAAARHAIGMLALAGMGMILVVNTLQPRKAATEVAQSARLVAETETLPISPAIELIAEPVPSETPPPAPGPEVSGAAPALPSAPPTISAAAQQGPGLTERLKPILPWLAGFWLLGVALLSLRQMAGWCCIRRWRRVGVVLAPIPLAELGERVRSRLGLAREGPILISQHVIAPLLAGVIKPVVLMPVAIASGLKPDELEAILAHELAHLRRRDGWANLFQVGIETLMFYHPVIWWLGRLTRRERENATDDFALESGTSREIYVTALAAVAELQAHSPALAASGGSVLARIRRLLSPVPEKRMTPAVAGLASGLALAVVVGSITLSQLSIGVAQEEDRKEARVEVAVGESIQEAIDAAEPGTLIVLGEGIYSERIQISQALAIEGAGWDKTILKPEGGQEIASAKATITISGARDVSLSGIQVSLSAVEQKAATLGGDRGNVLASAPGDRHQ